MTAIPHAYHHIDLINCGKKAPNYTTINRPAQVPSIANLTCFAIAAYASDTDFKIYKKPTVTAWQSSKLAQYGRVEVETLLLREDQV